MSGEATRGPGWYEDPQRPGWNRWWDGAAWAEYWSEAGTHTPIATPSPEPTTRGLRFGPPPAPAAPPPPPTPPVMQPAPPPADSPHFPDAQPNHRGAFELPRRHQTAEPPALDGGDMSGRRYNPPSAGRPQPEYGRAASDRPVVPVPPRPDPTRSVLDQGVPSPNRGYQQGVSGVVGGAVGANGVGEAETRSRPGSMSQPDTGRRGVGQRRAGRATPWMWLAAGAAGVVALGSLGWFATGRGDDAATVAAPTVDIDSESSTTGGASLDPVTSSAPGQSSGFEPGVAEDSNADGGVDSAREFPPLGAPGFFDACNQPAPVAIPGTDIEVPAPSEEQLLTIGESIRNEVLSQYPISTDEQRLQRIGAIRDAMAQAAPDEVGPVTLLETTEIQAFVIPGGDVFFTTGILEVMTDDELAFVMGHELTHEFCGHLRDSLQREAVTLTAADVLNQEFDLGIETATLEEAATQLFVVGDLTFGRQDEHESDRGALDLMLAADVPLQAAPAALQVIMSLENAAGGVEGPDWMQTHPATADRISSVESEIAVYDAETSP